MNYKKVIYNEVQVWFLRRHIPEKNDLDKDFQAILQNNINPEEYLKIYFEIGGRDWQWTERILLSKRKLIKKLNESFREIYYYYSENNLLGYFELDFSKEEVEIVYFGLLPDAIGKGAGKAMMNSAFDIIKKHNRKTVMLHTCSGDSPQALDYYKKMGFEVFKTIYEDQAKIIF